MIPEITIIVLLLSFDGVCIQIDRLGADAAAARCYCLRIRMSTSTQIYKGVYRIRAAGYGPLQGDSHNWLRCCII